MKIFYIFFSVLVLLVTSEGSPVCASNENSGMTKYRNYLPKEILSLGYEVRRKEVPIAYINAATLGAISLGQTIIKRELNGLMYPAMSDLTGAIKSFQFDLGEKQTGTLTVGQIFDLENRYKIQNIAPVYVPASLDSDKSDEFAEVRGVQIMLDETIAWPVNHITIRCFRSQKYCVTSQITVSLPTVNSFSYQFDVNDGSPDYYKITSWTKNTIDAIPSEESFEKCRTTSLSLNFSTKEYYFITRNLTEECEFMGQKIPKLERPRTTQVIDGWKTLEAIYANMRQNAYKALSSSYRSEFEQSAAKSELESKELDKLNSHITR